MVPATAVTTNSLWKVTSNRVTNFSAVFNIIQHS